MSFSAYKVLRELPAEGGRKAGRRQAEGGRKPARSRPTIFCVLLALLKEERNPTAEAIREICRVTETLNSNSRKEK